VIAALTLAASITATTIAEIENLDLGELQSVGFELKKDARVDIEAVGARLGKSASLAAYAWLIDSKTRELVWEMKSRHTERVRGDEYLRELKDSQSLPAGKYELYFWASQGWLWEDDGFEGIKVLIKDIFKGDWDGDYDELDDAIESCYVRMTSDELDASDISEFEVTGEFGNPLIRHAPLRDSEFIRAGFELDKKMDLRIYSIIEYPRGYRTPVDGAWIIDNKTRDRVWEMTKWDLDHAGGGRKNQVFNDEINLPAGSYTLTVVTDDSHSFEEFNVRPPYDPLNWGVTILPGRDFTRSAFHTAEVPERGEPLIDFTRARDNDYFEQSFSLSREITLQVYAIGEYSSGGRHFVDYGAIQDVATGKVVWEMTDRNTMHAGGGDKNRMFDATVTLPKGTYTAFYLTDDSHSYRDWNTSPPYDARAYGMAVYAASPSDASAFKKVTEEEMVRDENILARIVRVGDDMRRRERFTLNDDAWVHIYALGEGTGGRMHDFAYIVDVETGKDVWEMTWRKTDHAGGASKNRVFDDSILLPAGEYEVVYMSDDSHSFWEWNATPPRDPMNWGVVISLNKR
jgi:hypothetical protein